MRNNYWLAMDINGTLFVYCDDCKFHPIFTVAGDGWRELAASPHYRPVCPLPYLFDGSEVVTADCIPSFAVDVYYSESLPVFSKDFCGR